MTIKWMKVLLAVGLALAFGLIAGSLAAANMAETFASGSVYLSDPSPCPGQVITLYANILNNDYPSDGASNILVKASLNDSSVYPGCVPQANITTVLANRWWVVYNTTTSSSAATPSTDYNSIGQGGSGYSVGVSGIPTWSTQQLVMPFQVPATATVGETLYLIAYLGPGYVDPSAYTGYSAVACLPITVSSSCGNNLTPQASIVQRVEGVTGSGNLVIYHLDYNFVNTSSTSIADTFPACETIVRASTDPLGQVAFLAGNTVTWDLPDVNATASPQPYTASGSLWVEVQLGAGCTYPLCNTPVYWTNPISGNAATFCLQNGSTIMLSKRQMDVNGFPIPNGASLLGGSQVKYELDYNVSAGPLACFDSFDSYTKGTYSPSASGPIGFSGAWTPGASNLNSADQWNIVSASDGYALQFVPASTSTSYASLYYNCPAGSAQTSTCTGYEMVSDIMLADPNSATMDIGVWMQSDNAASPTGYMVIVSGDSYIGTTSNVHLGVQRSNGTSGSGCCTWAGSAPNAQCIVGTWYTLRAMMQEDGNIYAKFWQRGTPEPSAWMLDYQDNNPLPCPSTNFIGVSGMANKAEWDNFRVIPVNNVTGMNVWDTVPVGIAYGGSASGPEKEPVVGSRGLLAWDFMGTDNGAVGGGFWDGGGSFTWQGSLACGASISVTNVASILADSMATVASNSVNVQANCSAGTATITPTATRTAMPTGTSTCTPTPTPSTTAGSSTMTRTPSFTASPSPTFTQTAGFSTATSTPSPTSTPIISAILSVEGDAYPGSVEMLLVDYRITGSTGGQAQVSISPDLNILSAQKDPVSGAAAAISGTIITWSLPSSGGSEYDGQLWVRVQVDPALSAGSTMVSILSTSGGGGVWSVDNNVTQVVMAGPALTCSPSASALGAGEQVTYTLAYSGLNPTLSCFDDFSGLTQGQTYLSTAIPGWQDDGNAAGPSLWKALQENAGSPYLQYQNSPAGYRVLYYACPASLDNGEDFCGGMVVADVRIDGNASSGDAAIAFRQDPATGKGYMVGISIDPNPGNLYLQVDSPSPAWPVSGLYIAPSGHGPVQGAWYTIKVLESPVGTFMAKYWLRGAPEPSAWMFTCTDTTIPCTAGDGLLLKPGIAGMDDLMSFEDFRVFSFGPATVWDTIPSGINYVTATAGVTKAGSLLSWQVPTWLASSGSLTWVGSPNCPSANGTQTNDSTMSTDLSILSCSSSVVVNCIGTPTITATISPTSTPSPTASSVIGTFTPTASFTPVPTSTSTPLASSCPSLSDVAFLCLSTTCDAGAHCPGDSFSLSLTFCNSNAYSLQQVNYYVWLQEADLSSATITQPLGTAGQWLLFGDSGAQTPPLSSGTWGITPLGGGYAVKFTTAYQCITDNLTLQLPAGLKPGTAYRLRIQYSENYTGQNAGLMSDIAFVSASCATATSTQSPSQSPSFTPTASFTASITPSRTPTPTQAGGSSTMTPTPTPTASGVIGTPTFTPTPSAVLGTPTMSVTWSAITQKGIVERVICMPSVVRKSSVVEVFALCNGSLPTASLRLYTGSYTLVREFSSGPMVKGWNRFILPAGWFNGLANGLYHLTLAAPVQASPARTRIFVLM